MPGPSFCPLIGTCSDFPRFGDGEKDSLAHNFFSLSLSLSVASQEIWSPLSEGRSFGLSAPQLQLCPNFFFHFLSLSLLLKTQRFFLSLSLSQLTVPCVLFPGQFLRFSFVFHLAREREKKRVLERQRSGCRSGDIATTVTYSFSSFFLLLPRRHSNPFSSKSHDSDSGFLEHVALNVIC